MGEWLLKGSVLAAKTKLQRHHEVTWGRPKRDDVRLSHSKVFREGSVDLNRARAPKMTRGLSLYWLERVRNIYRVTKSGYLTRQSGYTIC